MAAITLLEAMKQAQGRGEMLEAGVYATYLESQLFQYLKFQEIPGNSLSFLQEDVLGMATFRACNPLKAFGSSAVEDLITAS